MTALLGARRCAFKFRLQNGYRFASTSRNLLQSSPKVMIEEILKTGNRRASIIFDRESGTLKASHPMMNEFVEFCQSDSRDFHEHEAIYFEVGKESGELLSAAVHKTVRGAGAGGVRLWAYDTMEGMLRDGLRLSVGMGRKNALAGLWWGGGKGVVARPEATYTDPEVRARIFRDYGRFVTGLHGCYVTAEDVGVRVEDMANIFTTTRHTTCIPETLGGSGNPSVTTALGVVCGMEAGLDHLGMGPLKGKKVAMQGAGNVATHMIEYLLEREVGSVVATDVSKTAVEQARARFASHPEVQVSLVPLGDNAILGEEADVVAPNALGGVLNQKTIPMIKAKVVCGAANNQLLDEGPDGKALSERAIYIPDFVANRMGIVNCANECYGYIGSTDPAIQRHFSRDWENSVYCVSRRILKVADETGKSSAETANELADEAMRQPHPIWNHRVADIHAFNLKTRWHTKEL